MMADSAGTPIQFQVIAISRLQSGTGLSQASSLKGEADCSNSGQTSEAVSRELGVPASMIDRWWLQRANITRQYTRYCRAKDDDTDLLRFTKKHQDNLAGSSTSPAPEDLKDPDFNPEGEEDSEEEGRGRRGRKKAETTQMPPKKAGGRAKKTEQGEQFEFGLIF